MKLKANLITLGGLFDLPLKKEIIQNLEQKMEQADFWEDHARAQAVIAELNEVKSSVEQYEKLQFIYDDLLLMHELASEEEDDRLWNDVVEGVVSLSSQLAQFEMQLLLSHPYDKLNAIVELHPGAGGTESQDWGLMLLRMYTRWAEHNRFKVEVLHYLPGEEAGIKSVTLLIKGHNAYGHLKGEKGVHRLVRLSPFDSSGRRHTSFASCDVVPEIVDEVEVHLRVEDLKIDTYRASGAGGQHINTTDSAVRITHVPTGIVVTCQNERSQIKNKERAMTMLRSKLYEQKIQQQQQELEHIRGEQADIAWGSQIRSYVFHPYNMVKDHRTGVETGNVQAVMDGEIDAFIDGYLRSHIK